MKMFRITTFCFISNDISEYILVKKTANALMPGYTVKVNQQSAFPQITNRYTKAVDKCNRN